MDDHIGVIQKLTKEKTYVLSVTTTPKAFPKTSKLANGNDRIRTALGLHPQLIAERSNELSLFETLLPETRYVGEVGIDGGKEYSTSLEKQKDVFKSILQMCSKNGNKIISIHSRHATTEVLDSLENNLKNGIPVLHWFTGNIKELERAIEMDCWFSVGKPMLTTKKGLEAIRRIPKNRILTETDAPFTGGAILTSLKKTEKLLGGLWDQNTSSTSEMLLNNLSSLVR